MEQQHVSGSHAHTPAARQQQAAAALQGARSYINGRRALSRAQRSPVAALHVCPYPFSLLLSFLLPALPGSLSPCFHLATYPLHIIGFAAEHTL